MATECNIFGAFTLFLFLNIQIVNTFQRPPAYFKTHYTISPHHSNRFAVDHYRHIAARFTVNIFLASKHDVYNGSYSMLHTQLFLQPQHLHHRENSLPQLMNCFFGLSAYLTNSTVRINYKDQSL